MKVIKVCKCVGWERSESMVVRLTIIGEKKSFPPQICEHRFFETLIDPSPFKICNGNDSCTHFSSFQNATYVFDAHGLSVICYREITNVNLHLSMSFA